MKTRLLFIFMLVLFVLATDGALAGTHRLTKDFSVKENTITQGTEVELVSSSGAQAFIKYSDEQGRLAIVQVPSSILEAIPEEKTPPRPEPVASTPELPVTKTKPENSNTKESSPVQIPPAAKKIEGIEAEPGRISKRIQCADNPDFGYFLYLPKEFHTGKKWPVWFIMFSGGGSNGGPLRRYIEGAELTGCILALSNESKNGYERSYEAIRAMVDDVFKRTPADENMVFTSGFSGGSRCAYYLAENEKGVQGVLACGSGSGFSAEGGFREAKLRKSTYVYSLIGGKCFNRTGATKSHESFPDHFRLRFFPGGHDFAASPLIKEGMARVVAEGLRNLSGVDGPKRRLEHAERIWPMVESLIEKQPWEAYYWAEFLSNYESGPIQDKASQLAMTLKADPKVQLALEADEEMLDFRQEFYDGVFYKVDRQPNEDRTEEGNELAEKYVAIPHGELFKQLGEPCK